MHASSNRQHFFILGAPKSGTTSLHYYLSQHPGVRFPVIKEPVFFESEFDKGLGHYYAKYFPDADPTGLFGDARPINLFLPFVPERIARSFPEARMLAILRDPIDRAYSHWWMRHCKDREPLSFDDAIEANLAGVEQWARLQGPEGPEMWKRALSVDSGESSLRVYVEIGYYAEQLERYLQRFRPEQLLVINSSYLQKHPAESLSRACQFLGLPDYPSPPDLSIQNSGESRGRSKLLSSAYRTGLSGLVPSGLKRAVKKALVPEVRRPVMSEAARARLTAHYAPHAQRLDETLRRLQTLGFPG